MPNVHPYTEARPSFKQVYFDATYNIGSDNYPLNNVVSASITYNYNADSFASITIEKADFTGSNINANGEIVHDSLIAGVSSGGEEYTLSINIGGSLFTGIIEGISENPTTITLNASNKFNRKIKNGEIKELDFISDSDLLNIFNVSKPITEKQYSLYFEDACKYTKAIYAYDGSDIVRSTLTKDIVISKYTALPKRILTLDLLSSVNSSYTDESTKTKISNVIDLVVYVKFKRYNTLIKKINLSSSLDLPSGLRSTFTTNNSDGSTTTLYKTYDRPARLSAIVSAIKEAGWSLNNTTKSEFTSNILDLDGSVIYSPSIGDDIHSASIDAYRYSVQDVTLPYIMRFINTDNLRLTGEVNYKKIEKEYIYNSEKPTTFSGTFSNYVDVYDWTNKSHYDYIEILKNRVLFEMKGGDSDFFKDNINLTSISADTVSIVGMDITDKPIYPKRVEIYGFASQVALSFNDIIDISLLDKIDIPGYTKIVVFNKSVTWSSTGEATCTLSCKNFIPKNFMPGGEDDLKPVPELPQLPEIISNSAPHSVPGSGLLQVNGTEADWLDDNSWAFENDVTLSRYYGHYKNTAELTEQTNPELTESNYYVQSVYVNKKVDINTLPYASNSSQCRIKNDKVKSVYTKAIILPPIIEDVVDISE